MMDTEVTFSALLAAKERRAQRQKEWLSKYQRPVISLTLVTPGALKDSIRYRNCMAVALQACDQMLWQHRWPVLKREVLWLATGAEALWSVGHLATGIKAAAVALEQTHPLGRLWDIDVLCPQLGSVGRQTLGLPARRCLLCSAPAHACVRSRRHPTSDVIHCVERQIDGWLARD